MSRRPDPELSELFGDDSDLQEIANLLRSSRMKAPPLDPGFRQALRRRVMTQAYNRYESARRPGLFSRLFGGPGLGSRVGPSLGPRFALVTAAVAALLIGVIYLQSGDGLIGGGRPPATTVSTNSQLVALDQPITVTFSQPMDHQSVQQAIRIEPATAVTYQWQGNNLLIQPASGQLAANTQYHITVSAQATTATHAPIGQAANIAVVTTGPPSPKPSPTPTPTPEARATITGERSLLGISGTIAGWSADGGTVYFLAQNGDLDSIRTDGQGLKALATGAARVWVSIAGRIAYSGRDGRVVVINPDGTASPAPGAAAVTAAGWQGNKLLVLSGGKVGAAGGDALASLPDPADSASFSPDGNKLLYRSGIRTVLLDLATQKAVTWPAGDPQKITWAPDSSRLAYLSGDSVFTALPDGSGAKVIGKSQGASTEIAWLGAGGVLISGATGLQMVRPDGAGLVALSTAAYVAPSGSPTPDRFGFSRDGVIWLADVKVVTPGVATLDQGYAVVTAFETARVSRDASRAAAYLTASAARTAAPATPGEPHLKRFFLVSSQQVANDGATQRFLVRLILADEHDNEVRYQDEQLTVVANANGSGELKIDGLSEGPVRPLGKGPNVNAVQIQATGLVVAFDSDLNPATIAANIKISAVAGEPLSVATAYSQRQVTVTAPLVAGRRYKLVVGADLKDIAGQQMAGGAYEYEFVAPAISG